MDRILAFRGLLKVGLADPFPMLLMIGTGNFQTVVPNPSRDTIASKQAIQIGFTGTEGGFMYPYHGLIPFDDRFLARKAIKRNVMDRYGYDGIDYTKQMFALEEGASYS